MGSYDDAGLQASGVLGALALSVHVHVVVVVVLSCHLLNAPLVKFALDYSVLELYRCLVGMLVV